jgi:hypothetical protein
MERELYFQQQYTNLLNLGVAEQTINHWLAEPVGSKSESNARIPSNPPLVNSLPLKRANPSSVSCPDPKKKEIVIDLSNQ